MYPGCPHWLHGLRKPVKNSSGCFDSQPRFVGLLHGQFIECSCDEAVRVTQSQILLMPLTPELLKDKLDEGWQLGDLYRVGDARIGGWPW